MTFILQPHRFAAVASGPTIASIFGSKLGWDWNPDVWGAPLADDAALSNNTVGQDSAGATVWTSYQVTAGLRPIFKRGIVNGHHVACFGAGLATQLGYDWDPDVQQAAAGGAILAVLARPAANGGTTGDSRAVLCHGENVAWGGVNFDPGRTHFTHRFGTGEVANNVNSGAYADLGAGFYSAAMVKRVSDDTEAQYIDGAQVGATATAKIDQLAGSTLGGTIGLGQFTAAGFEGDIARIIWVKQEPTAGELDAAFDLLISDYAL